MQNIRTIENKLWIYDSETDQNLAMIPDNKAQRDAWVEQLAIRQASVLISEGDQKTSDEYHIALYENFISEYDREIVNIN